MMGYRKPTERREGSQELWEGKPMTDCNVYSMEVVEYLLSLAIGVCISSSSIQSKNSF